MGVKRSDHFGKVKISGATAKNWAKLNTVPDGRLTSRANKRCSSRRIEPLEYMADAGNLPIVRAIVRHVVENHVSLASAMFSLSLNLLRREGLEKREHVRSVLEAHPCRVDDFLANAELPEGEFDSLGLLYQSLLTEGDKNILGSYYTPKPVVDNMVRGFSFSKGELVLDPCCGSGMFLSAVSAPHPSQLFGVDVDPIAVMIAKINLLIKYPTVEFDPQIYHVDFFDPKNPVLEKRFDYVLTNPPWGSQNDVAGREAFSSFFARSLELLKKHGVIKFLFPESVLNVKNHASTRRLILENGLKGITLYDGAFTGVVTKYADVECEPNASRESFIVRRGGEEQEVALDTVYETENCVFNCLSQRDLAIIRTVKQKGVHSLRESVWGLGIVTGDNKGKLFESRAPGMERIYTGKEIQPWRLKPARKYIRYDRSRLQQVARDEIYRAPEKLAYKFISKKLVFAYDDTSSLFLNSANILIPEIPGMSVKTVMAFLNSPLFRFLYLRLFGEVKILKGNLLELPFPAISEACDKALSALVDQVLKGDMDKERTIEDIIFSIYDFESEQMQHVRDVVDGKTN